MSKINVSMRWAPIVGFAVFAPICQAQLFYDSHGFESPFFSSGDLFGQDGWTDAGSGGTMTVTPGAGFGGTAGVVARHPGGEIFASALRTKNAPVGVSDSMRVDINMRLGEDWFAGLTDNSYYRAGVAIFLTTSGGSTELDFLAVRARNQFLGDFEGYMLWVDGTHSDSPQSLQLGSWRHLTLGYDNASGLVTASLNNVPILNAFGTPMSATQLDFLVFASVRAGNSKTDAQADFDNVTLVPEPISAIALGVGLSALAMRRRHKFLCK